jgi:hypothetical protein
MKKTALVISIAVTALVLIALGGIFTSVQSNARAAAQSNDKNASKISDPNLDPSIQQLINDREQSYQDLIAQANQRIDQLQNENQQLHDQLNALQTGSSNGQSAAGLSPDQAAQVAANYLGETDLYSLESGMFNGIPVYKVTFSSGSIVLVGMDGQIVAQQIVSNNNSGLSRFFGEHEEHQGSGGDD